MSDDRPCPNPLVPALIGGVVGAALVSATRSRDEDDLRRQTEQLAALERDRLAEEKKRLQLAQTEHQCHESERTYHHAIVWLEHCNNEERLDYLIQQHGAVLADRLAASLLDEARARPALGPLFESVSAAQARCRCLDETMKACKSQLGTLRRHRWTCAGVFWRWAGGGFAVLLACWVAIDTPLLAPFVGYACVLALVAPIAVRFQPSPDTFRSRGLATGEPAQGRLQDDLARLETAVAAIETEYSSATIDLALAREALAQTFAALRPTIAADAIRHTAAPRLALVELQSIYPPRLRCDLAALADSTLAARLAALLPSALTARLGKLAAAAPARSAP